MTLDAAKKLGEIYGPYAFGMISLVLLWFSILRPELDRTRANHEESAAVIQAVRDVTANMGRQSDSMIRQSESMERTAIILEAVASQLKGAK